MMSFNDSIELTKVVLLIALMTLCSVTDLSVRRIPNVVLYPALITGLFLNSAVDGLNGLADSLAGLTIGLLMLMPMHVLGRMGAGDIKLLGVVGSVLGAWGAIIAGLATMMAGGILAVAYLLWSVIKPRVVLRASCFMQRITGRTLVQVGSFSLKTVRAAEIPYAIAIAAGTFATLVYLDLLTEVGIT
jgi:prepilin peptidase CpaA